VPDIDYTPNGAYTPHVPRLAGRPGDAVDLDMFVLCVVDRLARDGWQLVRPGGTEAVAC